MNMYIHFSLSIYFITKYIVASDNLAAISAFVLLVDGIIVIKIFSRRFFLLWICFRYS